MNVWCSIARWYRRFRCYRRRCLIERAVAIAAANVEPNWVACQDCGRLYRIKDWPA